MPEFTATGTVTLRGVVFTITADTEAEARKMAKDGKCDDWDMATGEASDWDISPGSVRQNED